MGGTSAPLAPSSILGSPRSRWRLVQEYLQHVWSRFLKELLPSLNPRTKWAKHSVNISVGDIVLVLDNQTPRDKWPLGRVIEVYPGIDLTVRVAKVQLQNKTITRPVVKLIPILDA